MLKRVTIAVLLVLALFLAPQAPVRACAMSMPAPLKMQCTSCCAAMKSCVLPQQNPTQPASAATADLAPIAMIAPALPVLLRQLRTQLAIFPRSAAQTLTHAPPRLAVLCTFLI